MRHEQQTRQISKQLFILCTFMMILTNGMFKNDDESPTVITYNIIKYSYL